MVIDGLPAEFVLGRGDKPPTKAMMEAMPYTQSLLSGGKAQGYYAKAAPPTVTMPRFYTILAWTMWGILVDAIGMLFRNFHIGIITFGDCCITRPTMEKGMISLQLKGSVFLVVWYKSMLLVDGQELPLPFHWKNL
ncbi:hypothetical protein GW17_00014775 [Ensete ventricosum]|nr:hypothetical protein GW17_00014775 [Ensete ventricosum]RZS09641.1 hypothetical protein BHM03_00040733 [Ensete ventricosum]